MSADAEIIKEMAELLNVNEVTPELHGHWNSTQMLFQDIMK